MRRWRNLSPRQSKKRQGDGKDEVTGSIPVNGSSFEKHAENSAFLFCKTEDRTPRVEAREGGFCGTFYVRGCG